MKKRLLFPLFLAGIAIPVLANGKEIKGVDAAFIGEYGEVASYLTHASAVNGQLAEEGFVLLKNDGTFPIRKGSKITLAGTGSTNLVYGMSASAIYSGNYRLKSYDLESSLKEAGFDLNPKALSFYKSTPSGRTNGNDGWRGNSEVTIGEAPIKSIKENGGLLDSFEEYNDLAIQVISREGSEGCDVLTIDATDDTKFGSSNKHALELSDNEQDLYDELHKYFKKILILINSSNCFECGQFMNDPKVAGILWIGTPNYLGPKAIGQILCGDVNPSGHTVDTWTRDFTKDPTFQNFSDNRQNTGVEIPGHVGRQNHQSADTMLYPDGSPMRDYGADKAYTNAREPRYLEDPQYKVVKGGLNGVKPATYVSYEEGVYLDYRYYETRYVDIALTRDKNTADEWYNGQEGVVFPFGYGLSYTTFEQKFVRAEPVAETVLNENNDLIEVSVKVTNTGNRPGKDVVQIYWKAPYKKGEIEKAHHVLCAFDKTKLLKPGESQYVHLSFHLQDVANYDYKDANKNGFTGYELDAGNYEIMLMKNAHEEYSKSIPLIVKDGGIKYEVDRFTGHEVTNRFTKRGFYSSMPGEKDVEFTEMSRASFEGTFPSYPLFEDRKVKDGSMYDQYLTHAFDLASFEKGDDFFYVPGEAFRTAKDGANWKQTGNHTIKLIDMKDYELSNPKWNEFIDEFSWDDLLTFVENHKMSSPSMTTIDKLGTSEGNGPQMFSIIPWVTPPIVASTYNPRLAHEMGECVGMESQMIGKSGWWEVSATLHRSPFGGRNFLFYSADPYLTGRIVSEVVDAATDRGVYCYVSHFVAQEQEKNREGGSTFVNEQALRELYLKPFQMCVEEAKTVGIMASYNRLGLMETAASYPLLTEVLRGEWGFEGSVLSQMNHNGSTAFSSKYYENVAYRVLAGCNCQLDSNGFKGQIAEYYATWDENANNGKGAPVINDSDQIAWSLWGACREAVKQHLHMFVNSTGMQRGLTQVIGQKDITVTCNESFSFNVANDVEKALVDKLGYIVDTYDNKNNKTEKEVKTIESYELNDRCELPEGITFDARKCIISGQLKTSQLVRIDMIINVRFTDDTEGKIAYKYVIESAPDIVEDINILEIDTPVKECSMSIAAASVLISMITIAGAMLLLLRRKDK